MNRQSLRGMFGNATKSVFEDVNKKKTRTGSTGRKKIDMLLEEEAYEAFDKRTWRAYFEKKAKDNGYRFIPGNTAKEYSILQSTLNEFGWADLKLMIDFLWESNQDIKDKKEIGIWMLSKGWWNTVYNGAKDWEAGTYKPRNSKPPKRNREYIPEEKPVESKDVKKRGKLIIGR